MLKNPREVIWLPESPGFTSESFSCSLHTPNTTRKGNHTLLGKKPLPQKPSCQPWATKILLQPSCLHLIPLLTCHMTWFPGLCSLVTFSWPRAYPSMSEKCQNSKWVWQHVKQRRAISLLCSGCHASVNTTYICVCLFHSHCLGSCRVCGQLKLWASFFFFFFA